MNVYQTCYDLVNQFLYGGQIIAGSYMELVAIIVATAATLFVFAIPFIIVYRFIKIFC